MAGEFRFSFGPWNIHEGADPFGPAVRDSVSFNEKLEQYKKLGFDGVQFHDDDAVPALNDLGQDAIVAEAQAVKRKLDEHGLAAEFVAPRLWEDPRTIDGAYTSNDPASREYARDRTRRAVDIADALGTDLIVLWLAREGTYMREAKDSKVSVERILGAIDDIFEYSSGMRVAVEPKPNEPMDLAYIPTVGHALSLGARSKKPAGVGVVIESAHSILAGLDPSDEMGFALACNGLFSVHLNDQNGLKFDEDKSFGSVDLRRAFNQVRILDKYDYGTNGEWVGLDVKALRTQKEGDATLHLSNSKEIFLELLSVSRGMDDGKIEEMIAERNYEALDLYIMKSLLGK